jgi:hypothetical protein
MKQHKRKGKGNIHLFTKAVSYLNKIGKKTILKLALRFKTSPQRLDKLITKEMKGGEQNG